jgi:chaperonin cofactor prefoldin
MVHLSAAGAAQRLSAIESSAATLKASLDDNAQVLSALKEGLAENMSTIKKNFESMDERLGKLKSK